MSNSPRAACAERLAIETAARSTASTISGSFSGTMPSESPGSKVSPNPSSDTSRWIVCLVERLLLRLMLSVISAGNGLALE